MGRKVYENHLTFSLHPTISFAVNSGKHLQISGHLRRSDDDDVTTDVNYDLVCHKLCRGAKIRLFSFFQLQYL